jgi:hypothetical protein
MGHGMVLPFNGQPTESRNPLSNELFLFEQERVEGRISDDQGEYLITGQSGTKHLDRLSTNRTAQASDVRFDIPNSCYHCFWSSDW